MTYPPGGTERGFRPVLSGAPFRFLWSAQWLAQLSQNAINFIQLILIEQLTGSTMQIGIIILAFTLPGVLFSPPAGVVVDHFPKKWVLVPLTSHACGWPWPTSLRWAPCRAVGAWWRSIC